MIGEVGRESRFLDRECMFGNDSLKVKPKESKKGGGSVRPYLLLKLQTLPRRDRNQAEGIHPVSPSPLLLFSFEGHGRKPVWLDRHLSHQRTVSVEG